MSGSGNFGWRSAAAGPPDHKLLFFARQQILRGDEQVKLLQPEMKRSSEDSREDKARQQQKSGRCTRRAGPTRWRLHAIVIPDPGVILALQGGSVRDDRDAACAVLRWIPRFSPPNRPPSPIVRVDPFTPPVSDIGAGTAAYGRDDAYMQQKLNHQPVDPGQARSYAAADRVH